MKCDFCPDLAQAGSLPYCAQGCPNHAIYYGDLEEDLATNGKEVVKLSRFLSEDSTYRLKENLGTSPGSTTFPVMENWSDATHSRRGVCPRNGPGLKN